MLSKNEFHELFINELREIYNAEKQLTIALPNMIKAAIDQELKDAFNQHLEETKEQVSRLEQIFHMLHENSEGAKCEVMEELIKEGKESIEKYTQTPVRDAALIIAAQRIEHYEIAVYGALRTFAKQLDLDECTTLLQQSLNEEGQADKTLTEIAEGGFFTAGVNQRAAAK